MKNNTNYYIIILIYVILSILLSYPAFIEFSNPNILIGTATDNLQCAWDLWWIKESIFNGLNPFYSNLICYPNGINLLIGSRSLISGIIAIPLLSFFSVCQVYNILWILSFTLSSIGAFLLINYLINDIRISFFGGFAFSYCPFHYAHGLGHIGLFSIQWIPLYVLFLIKSYKEGGSINIFLCSIFLVINFLNDYTITFYLILLSALYLMYQIITDSKNYIKNIKTTIIIVSIFSFICSPIFYLMITHLTSGNTSPLLQMTDHIQFSADLMMYFTPSILSTFFGETFRPVYFGLSNLDYSGTTIFVGFTTLILAIIGFLLYKPIKEILFWIFSTIFFIILSLGPVLQINGIINISYNHFSSPIPLPYFLIMKIPLLSMAHAPGRASIIVMLTITILSCYGLSYLRSKMEYVYE